MSRDARTEPDTEAAIWSDLTQRLFHAKLTASGDQFHMADMEHRKLEEILLLDEIDSEDWIEEPVRLNDDDEFDYDFDFEGEDNAESS